MSVISNQALEYILESIKKQPSERFESEQVEFKNYSSEKSLLGDNDLIKEISALSNHKGGVIVVGVIDSSNIKDQKWEEQLKGFVASDYTEIQERLKGKIEPKIEILVEEFHFDRKYFTLIHVPKSYDRLIGTKSGKFCKRDGKSSIPMTSQEIEIAVKNLQYFDWTSEMIKEKRVLSLLDKDSLKASKIEYKARRKIEYELSDLSFLESIGATQNGYLNRGGFLFLGKKALIQKYLGNFEYRFSRKTKSGKLLLNEVWSSNLWNTIQRTKTYFNEYNTDGIITYQGEEYRAKHLDELAFHEAFLNALVHRDYAVDGMTVVNYLDSELKIASPGIFYGGVTPDNIGFHEPRHRNKTLANILMKFQFVDRAGMGIVRMGLGSLRYGRSFPEFKEKDNSVEVTMQTEFFKKGIFILSAHWGDSLGIPELLVLNLIYETGFVSVSSLEKRLSKISKDPWSSIKNIMSDDNLSKVIELCGNKEGIFVRVKEDYLDFMEVKRVFNPASNSAKHVNLYDHLKSFGQDTNSNLTTVLGYSQSSTTSTFLKNAEYVDSKGRGRNRKWYLCNGLQQE